MCFVLFLFFTFIHLFIWGAHAYVFGGQGTTCRICFSHMGCRDIGSLGLATSTLTQCAISQASLKKKLFLCMCVYATTHMNRSQDNFQELVLSFLPLWSPKIRLGQHQAYVQCFYLLSQPSHWSLVYFFRLCHRYQDKPKMYCCSTVNGIFRKKDVLK